MKCLILASGFGTRLYPLTFRQAKALLEYKGKPLLTHLVDKVPHNIDVLVTANRKFVADFYHWQECIDRRVEIGVEDVWTEEQRKGALGSPDFWIKQKNINEALLVLACDNYFEFNLSQFIAAYNGEDTLVAVHDIGDRSKATSFGVVQIDDGKIIELEEKPASPKSCLVATACYILPSRVFPILSRYRCENPEVDELGYFIAYLVKYDRVNAFIFTETWLDVASALL